MLQNSAVASILKFRQLRMAPAPQFSLVLWRARVENLSMDIEPIRAQLRRSPFKPFALVMADGGQVIVPHHDYLLISPGGGTMMVFSTPEDFVWIDTAQVTQVIPNQSSPTGKAA